MAIFICRGKPDGVFSKKEARAMNKPGIEGHKKRSGCGYDLDKIFREVPKDGEEYLRKCPQCSNIFPVKKYPLENPNG